MHYPFFISSSLARSINASDVSTIDNLSNDVTHVVVLYAAVRAAEALLAEEEDAELYIPMINSLKQDYAQAIQAMGAKVSRPKGGPNEG